MTSEQSSNSNAIEVDGIWFETVVPERVVTVPTILLTTYTSVPFGIRITNNILTSLYFNFFNSSWLPELLTPEGQILQPGFSSERLLKPIESDFLLAMPGESVTFCRNATLYWRRKYRNREKRNQELKLSIPFRDEDFFVFGSLNPGSYHIRFRYEQTRDRLDKLHYWIEPKILEEVWTGQVLTPFVEFSLVKP